MIRPLIFTLLFPALALAADVYDLRAFTVEDGKVVVDIRRNGDTRSFWLVVGKADSGLLVESADPKQGVAVLNAGGEHFNLKFQLVVPPETQAEKDELIASKSLFARKMRKLCDSTEYRSEYDACLELTVVEFRSRHPEIPEGGDILTSVFKRNSVWYEEYDEIYGEFLVKASSPVMVRWRQLDSIDKRAQKEASDYQENHVGVRPGEAVAATSARLHDEWLASMLAIRDRLLVESDKGK